MSGNPELSSDDLVRGLGRWDSTLLTVGSVIGTGIFITSAGSHSEFTAGALLGSETPSESVTILDTPIGLAVAGFLALSAIFHVVVASRWLKHTSSVR